jgi:hypothetical protein
MLGVAASAIAIVVSLAFISLFDFGTFVGNVSFVMLCLIPMQIVVVVTWGAKPRFAARFTQPARGLTLLVTTAVGGVLIAPLALMMTGEGITPPGPIPSHFVIAVVPTTFWLAIMWGGWPFTTAIRNPVAAGVTVLAAAYLFTYAIFHAFFDYQFLDGTPAQLASSPRGMFFAIDALVFYVTALAGMFVVLCFDLWPVTTSPTVMKQPLLGLVWTVAAVGLGGLAMYVGVGLMGTDPMIFLTRVTAPFIFGTIIVLNMLQNSLVATMAQPLKGVMNTVAATVIGVALATLYGVLSPMVTGTLPSGGPGYEYEIWLANALLSVTFPLLIFYAAYFDYWPLAKAPAGARRGEGVGA